MTKVVFNRTIPMIDRDSFLTPFDKLFDQMEIKLRSKLIQALEQIE